MKTNRSTLLLLLLLTLLVSTRTTAQSIDPYIQSLAGQVSYDSVLDRLQTFEDLGVKEAGTDALDNTRDWIIGLYQQWGYTAIEVDSFTYNGLQVQNIIVTKTGSLYPESYLIVDGHYDTYSGPGVNDNGSGTAAILETARIMKDVETDYSIRFIHFTVEEMGLVGSGHYVENSIIPENTDILLVFNIDEIGGVAGEVNNTITCERDEWPPNANNAASAAYTDTLATLTELYSDLETSISYAYGSDYVPFMNAGYVVTGFYEYNESPYPHSSNDLLSNMDPAYVFEATKAALASTLYFSGVHEVFSGTAPDEKAEVRVIIRPNPFQGSLELMNPHESPVLFELLDANGNSLYSNELLPSSVKRVVLPLQEGIYLYKITSGKGLLQTGKLIAQ